MRSGDLPVPVFGLRGGRPANRARAVRSDRPPTASAALSNPDEVSRCGAVTSYGWVRSQYLRRLSSQVRVAGTNRDSGLYSQYNLQDGIRSHRQPSYGSSAVTAVRNHRRVCADGRRRPRAGPIRPCPDPVRSFRFVDDRCRLLEDNAIQGMLGAGASSPAERCAAPAACPRRDSRPDAGAAAPLTMIDVVSSGFETGSLDHDAPWPDGEARRSPEASRRTVVPSRATTPTARALQPSQQPARLLRLVGPDLGGQGGAMPSAPAGRRRANQGHAVVGAVVASRRSPLIFRRTAGLRCAVLAAGCRAPRPRAATQTPTATTTNTGLRSQEMQQRLADADIATAVGVGDPRRLHGRRRQLLLAGGHGCSAPLGAGHRHLDVVPYHGSNMNSPTVL